MSTPDNETTNEAEAVKVSKWDGNAVKNALDDAIRKIVEHRYDLVENTKLIDGRLIVSTIAVGLALLALVWDWLHPYPKSRPVLIFCVLGYFLLMGVLQLYTWYCEGGTFYCGIDEDPTGKRENQLWSFSSKMNKFDHLYTLEIEFRQGNEKAKSSVECSVGSWIDTEGNVVQNFLERDVIKLYDSLAPTKKRN